MAGQPPDSSSAPRRVRVAESSSSLPPRAAPNASKSSQRAADRPPPNRSPVLRLSSSASVRPRVGPASSQPRSNVILGGGRHGFFSAPSPTPVAPPRPSRAASSLAEAGRPTVETPSPPRPGMSGHQPPGPDSDDMPIPRHVSTPSAPRVAGGVSRLGDTAMGAGLERRGGQPLNQNYEDALDAVELGAESLHEYDDGYPAPLPRDAPPFATHAALAAVRAIPDCGIATFDTHTPVDLMMDVLARWDTHLVSHGTAFRIYPRLVGFNSSMQKNSWLDMNDEAEKIDTFQDVLDIPELVPPENAPTQVRIVVCLTYNHNWIKDNFITSVDPVSGQKTYRWEDQPWHCWAFARLYVPRAGNSMRNRSKVFIFDDGAEDAIIQHGAFLDSLIGAQKHLLDVVTSRRTAPMWVKMGGRFTSVDACVRNTFTWLHNLVGAVVQNSALRSGKTPLHLMNQSIGASSWSIITWWNRNPAVVREQREARKRQLEEADRLVGRGLAIPPGMPGRKRQLRSNAGPDITHSFWSRPPNQRRQVDAAAGPEGPPPDNGEDSTELVVVKPRTGPRGRFSSHQRRRADRPL